jgi:hypothetical protein
MNCPNTSTLLLLALDTRSSRTVAQTQHVRATASSFRVSISISSHSRPPPLGLQRNYSDSTIKHQETQAVEPIQREFSPSR